VACRVHIVGGGVIGLACAWQLAAHGHRVTLVAPDPGGDGASWVAAGMLAPVTEAQFGEAGLTELLMEGAGRWKEFATGLEDATGHDIGFCESGTLTVALNASDRGALGDLLAYQHSLGLVAHRRTASECRALVPGLTPGLSGGIEVPGDHQVDNRALLAALVAAGQAAGVEFVRARVAAVGSGPELVLEGGHRLGSDIVLLAAGTALPAIAGLEEAGLPEVRPVKGHILRLGPATTTVTSPLLPRTLRALVRGRPIYLVPRRDGSVVVGATVEEQGYNTAVQVGPVQQLLADARQVLPGVDELELLQAQTGLRPATPDNRPCIGWTRLEGVAVATGHYRNGFLLAPLTAATVTALVDGQPLPPLTGALAPA
jgi:glycine oxidase